MLLGLDLGARAQAHPGQMRSDDFAELGLGQQEEVVGCASQDDERGDHARLRSQQKRWTCVPHVERCDVVRDHPLEVVLGVRAGDPDICSSASGDLLGNAFHPH